MKEEQIRQLYASPEMELIEIKTRETILAGSNPNSTESYDRETW